MPKKIITIAREYGSAGRLIAQRVAEKLNLIYYDNQIIDLAALELGFDIDTIRKAASERSSSFIYTMSSSSFQLPLNDQVFAKEDKACISVNGCADYVLEDFDDVLTVFIHAPLESRVKRVKEEYKEEHDDYVKFVKKQDKRRSNYYNYYTTKKWGQLKNFDLTINSDLGIEAVADIIVDLYNKG